MRLLNTLLPTPARSLLLFVVWLLLNNSIAPIHLLVAALLALVIPQLTVSFRDPQPPIRRWGLAVRYIARVLIDIVLANLQVIQLVLGPNKNLRPGFVLVPLSMTEALPLTILAGTVSLTPGTVSAEILPYQLDATSSAPKYLLLHVLDLQNEAELVASIKQRYEQPLKEIFQC
ncbi:Na+/H+ antiporter subunit E [Rheinheimera sp.]|uniref:Na+/H+ antiporter subunit E n=1 Tax=Rheinheimera sp. TaxID=1869214 RepID=UPI0027B9D7E8|nr:Na+/H+ antiporter subunit E [Rheinheimera sp.]